MHHISVSVQAPTPKLNQNPLSALISKLGRNALDMGYANHEANRRISALYEQ